MMKKGILILLILSISICLLAQQSEQLTKKKKGVIVKKKMDYEAEYHKMKEQRDALHTAYVTLTEEHEKLRNEKKKIHIQFEGSQSRHKAKDKKMTELMTENEHLKKENTRLREELKKYRPKKMIIAPDKDKKVEQK
jgi:predicted  nucleic acid-binding Zn-ribbon protein